MPGEECPIKSGNGDAHGAGKDQYVDAGNEPAHVTLSTCMRSISVVDLVPGSCSTQHCFIPTDWCCTHLSSHYCFWEHACQESAALRSLLRASYQSASARRSVDMTQLCHNARLSKLQSKTFQCTSVPCTSNTRAMGMLSTPDGVRGKPGPFPISATLNTRAPFKPF